MRAESVHMKHYKHIQLVRNDHWVSSILSLGLSVAECADPLIARRTITCSVFMDCMIILYCIY